ncbi:MAG: nucleotidyltransferase family protein [Bacteroidales bacterium]|nr:nucleotidyltransferase family protein [Candidatus Physcocola equi]
MKAMIFAAGLGTRLKPITDSIPKALVPISGKTLLEHVALKLIDAGFNDLVINVHHFSQQIIDFLKANNNFGVRIQVSDETDQLLDTGGGIRKATSFLQGNEPFLVHNVDILSNVDLKAIWDTHNQTNADATLLVSERQTQRYLLFDQEENMRLKGWTNIATGEVKSPFPDFTPDGYARYAFAGIHVISPQILQSMANWPEKFPIMDFYLKEAEALHIQANVANNLKMIDVGKINAIEQAEQFLKDN